MVISKALFFALLALLSAISARLTYDEITLRNIDQNTQTLAKWAAEQEREKQESEQFQKQVDDARKKHPTAWGGDAAKTLRDW